ncbi:carboxypeptidase regulatory-like domain-containing protein [Candidatus Palauibacter sp.]|uniref:carboxypeptidase regulatory-like domain-containing protein n=1 Tax=Candidatus Palauibacter sp. TaxID=3101350 RepID=UPI003B5AE2DA
MSILSISRGAFHRGRTAALLAALQLGVGAAAAPGQEQERECGERPELRVTVMDESGAVPLPGVVVAVQWTDGGRRPARGRTGEGGHYGVCAPRDAEGAVLWAEVGPDGSREVTVALERGGTHEVELRVVFAMSRPGRLLGRIYDARTDDPVATAAVSVVGRPGVVESNRQGQFVIEGIPRGERQLEVRRLGYALLRHPIVMSPGITTEVEVGLVPEPVEMEPLVAIAERSRRLEIKGFYERKHWGELLGLGQFFSEDDIERWRPTRMTHFIVDHTMLGSGLMNRRSGCAVNVFVDGMSVAVRDLDSVVLPIEVGGVEVYRGPASFPGRFSGSDLRCGAVAIWTK